MSPRGGGGGGGWELSHKEQHFLTESSTVNVKNVKNNTF